MATASDDAFFRRSATVPADVLVQRLPDGESVILHLVTERYYGLDEVGARMWDAVTGASTIAEAFALLERDYDIEPDALRADLKQLVETLSERGLLHLNAA